MPVIGSAPGWRATAASTVLAGDTVPAGCGPGDGCVTVLERDATAAGEGVLVAVDGVCVAVCDVPVAVGDAGVPVTEGDAGARVGVNVATAVAVGDGVLVDGVPVAVRDPVCRARASGHSRRRRRPRCGGGAVERVGVRDGVCVAVCDVPVAMGDAGVRVAVNVATAVL